MNEANAAGQEETLRPITVRQRKPYIGNGSALYPAVRFWLSDPRTHEGVNFSSQNARDTHITGEHWVRGGVGPTVVKSGMWIVGSKTGNRVAVTDKDFREWFDVIAKTGKQVLADQEAQRIEERKDDGLVPGSCSNKQCWEPHSGERFSAARGVWCDVKPGYVWKNVCCSFLYYDAETIKLAAVEPSVTPSETAAGLSLMMADQRFRPNSQSCQHFNTYSVGASKWGITMRCKDCGSGRDRSGRWFGECAPISLTLDAVKKNEEWMRKVEDVYRRLNLDLSQLSPKAIHVGEDSDTTAGDAPSIRYQGDHAPDGLDKIIKPVPGETAERAGRWLRGYQAGKEEYEETRVMLTAQRDHFERRLGIAEARNRVLNGAFERLDDRACGLIAALNTIHKVGVEHSTLTTGVPQHFRIFAQGVRKLSADALKAIGPAPTNGGN